MPQIERTLQPPLLLLLPPPAALVLPRVLPLTQHICTLERDQSRAASRRVAVIKVSAKNFSLGRQRGLSNGTDWPKEIAEEYIYYLYLYI